jgi:DNA-binding MarR family transcriptional regulator
LAVDPYRQYPGYLLRRASNASMERLARRLLTLKLRPSEATVLGLVEANPNITQSEIGRMLDIARANMAPLVARLVTRKLLLRQPVDGRSHGLWMTAAGRALALKVQKLVAAHESDLMSRIPAAHRKSFLAALGALWDSDSC